MSVAYLPPQSLAERADELGKIIAQGGERVADFEQVNRDGTVERYIGDLRLFAAPVDRWATPDRTQWRWVATASLRERRTYLVRTAESYAAPELAFEAALNALRAFAVRLGAAVAGIDLVDAVAAALAAPVRADSAGSAGSTGSAAPPPS